MDAATPFRQWFVVAAALTVAAGCTTTKPDPLARPQMPNDPPGPLAPPAPPPGQPVVQTSNGKSVEAKPAGLPAGEARIKIVAFVGAGNIVTDEEVWESVRQRLPDYTAQVDGPGGKQLVEIEAKKKAVYIEELRRTIERELILDEMYARLNKSGKGQAIEDIRKFASDAADRQMRAMKKQRGMTTDDDFRSMLLSQGLTIPVVRRQLERQMMADEYVRSMLREKPKATGLVETRAYYDAHPDEFRTPDRVRWIDVFVPFNSFANQRAAYDHAMAVRRQAAGGADFVALAKAQDPKAAGRANWDGIGTARGEIQPPDVEPTVWSLRPGEVSGLVETVAGYHIVKVVEREVAGVRPFDDKTQIEIRRKLMEATGMRERDRLIESLWRSGVVKVVEMPR